MAQSTIEIKVDHLKIERLAKQLQHIPDGLNKVVIRALNKTAGKAKTDIVRGISAQSGVKQKAVRNVISVVRATYKKWLAIVKIKKNRIPLIRFKARQTKTGVSYLINQEQGRQLRPHAFIAVMPKTGYRGVFIRKTKARLPLQHLYGPGIGTIYEEAKTFASKIVDQTYRNLNTQIDTQVKVLLNQVKKVG